MIYFSIRPPNPTPFYDDSVSIEDLIPRTPKRDVFGFWRKLCYTESTDEETRLFYAALARLRTQDREGWQAGVREFAKRKIARMVAEEDAAELRCIELYCQAADMAQRIGGVVKDPVMAPPRSGPVYATRVVVGRHVLLETGGMTEVEALEMLIDKLRPVVELMEARKRANEARAEDSALP